MRFSMVCRVQVVMVVELIVNFDSMPKFHLIDPSVLNSCGDLGGSSWRLSLLAVAYTVLVQLNTKVPACS